MKRLIPFLLVLVTVSVPSVGQQPQRPTEYETSTNAEPQRVTLCELLGTPKRFSGQTVQTTGILRTTMHATIIEDSVCGRSVLIELPSKSDQKATLKRDEKFDEFWQWIPKLLYQRNENRSVAVTLVGRFDTASTRGFGDHNLSPHRIVIKEVREVSVQPSTTTAARPPA